MTSQAGASFAGSSDLPRHWPLDLPHPPSGRSAGPSLDEVFRRRGDPSLEALFGPVPASDEELVRLAQARTPDQAVRSRALSTLLPYWRSLDLPTASQQAVEWAADPATRFVLTGQQPALAGGPLHLFVKALSVARLARRLRDHGVPTVALYWIADEDHDRDELFSGTVSGPNGERAMAVPFSSGRTPFYGLRLPPEELDADLVVAWFRENLPDGPDREALLDRLGRSFDPAPGEWFQKLLFELLPDEGLLPVRPSLLRELQAPIIAEEISQPGRLASEMEPTLENLRSLGFPVPIAQPATVPFFRIGDDGGRHRWETGARDGSTVFKSRQSKVDGETEEIEFTTAELLRDLENDPHRYSADALLRPLVQDTVLQPLATIVGPTELAYHLELSGVYEARGIPRPLLMPRLRVRVMGADTLERVRGLNVDPTSVASAAMNVTELLPSAHADTQVQRLQALASALTEFVAGVGQDSEATPALRKRADRLARRWEDDTEKLARIIERDGASDVSDERNELQRIHAELWPEGRDAERTRSVFFFLNQYGLDLWEQIGALVDPFDPRVQLLCVRSVSEREGIS